MLKALAVPCGVIVVPLHKMSPPELLVAPVSRLKAVLAARVGVPVTSARAAMGNAKASAITVIAVVEIRLSFIAPPAICFRLPESIAERPSFIYAVKRVETAHPAQSAEAKEDKPVRACQESTLPLADARGSVLSPWWAAVRLFTVLRIVPIREDAAKQPMLAVIGIGVVFLAVFGGFLMEQGNPWVLMQPAELLIVGGAAAGIILVANPPSLIRKMVRGSRDAFRPAAYGRQVFLLHLRMLYEVFGYVQRAGIVALETDVENPARSPIFSRYPGFLRDPETRDLVCDSLRMMVIGATTPQELDQLMDLDIDVQRRGRHEPVAALSTVADALPGLGIVATVPGVVITKQAIGGSPETVGQKVAAALVGTFLGILLCYGLVGPVAARLEIIGEAQAQFLQVLRIALVAFFRGAH